MATVEDIQHLVAQMEQSLSAKFEEIDRKHTILIQGLQQQFQQHEQRFIILEKASRPVTPVLQPQPVRSNVGQEIRPKAKGFQLSLERYGKPKSDLTTWIAQVEEKCALQNISNEEIGKWAKVHLE